MVSTHHSHRKNGRYAGSGRAAGARVDSKPRRRARRHPPLPTVMAEIMAESRSVNLEGLGSFHFTAQATGKGVETEDKVSADQFHLRLRAIHPRPPKARHRLHPQPRGERILHGVERPGAKAGARRRQREPRRDLIPPTRIKRERDKPGLVSLSLYP